MGKEKKQKTTVSEPKKDSFAFISDEDTKKFFERTIGKLEKLDRIQSKWQQVLDNIEKRIEQKNDPYLVSLRHQIKEFAFNDDARRQADFFNYGNKFTFHLDAE